VLPPDGDASVPSRKIRCDRNEHGLHVSKLFANIYFLNRFGRVARKAAKERSVCVRSGRR
jgi:hypothetical protein